MIIDYEALTLEPGKERDSNTGKVRAYIVNGLPSPLYAEIRGGGQQGWGYEFFVSEIEGTKPQAPYRPSKFSQTPEAALDDLKDYLRPKYPQSAHFTDAK